MDAYVSKPIRRAELVDAITKVMVEPGKVVPTRNEDRELLR
jgi:hypothetical protein